MVHAKLRVELPSGTWIRDVSTQFPAVTFRVLAAIPGAETGIGLVEVDASDLADAGVEDVLAAMQVHDVVASLDVLALRETSALAQFETEKPMLLLQAQESGIPFDLPLEIADGVADVEVTAPRDRLSALGEQFDAVGIQYAVEFVHRTPAEGATVLSERQRDLLTEAVERGYYDVPRTCTLTELADHLGIAKSTASERLHRAESAVVKHALGVDEE